MIKPNENGTMYDFVDSNHEAPKAPHREVGWQANRKDMSDPYVNKGQPQHVKQAMQIEQKDNSKMAWWRLFTGQTPKCSFERDVNERYGGRPQGEFNYEEKSAQYISFYKQAMEQL